MGKASISARTQHRLWLTGLGHSRRPETGVGPGHFGRWIDLGRLDVGHRLSSTCSGSVREDGRQYRNIYLEGLKETHDVSRIRLEIVASQSQQIKPMRITDFGKIKSFN